MDTNEESIFNILIVEDDDSEIFIIKKILESYEKNINLINITDGDATIKYLKRENEYENVLLPDLVMLDLNLPKRDGFEVLQIRLEYTELKKIPVIILTSSDYEKDIIKAYELGANGYSIKPLSYKEYKKLLMSILDFWMSYTLPS